MGTYRVCLCFTRKFGETENEVPLNVRELFEKYTGGDTQMTAEQLGRFLADQEAEGEKKQEPEKVVEEVMSRRHHRRHHHRHLHHHIPRLTSRKHNESMSLDDFFYFLFSADLNPPIKSQIHQDMSAPLSHYFIYTGHNSYLTGNQLSSDCSDVPIVRALERGVRVIELDLWPNFSKDDIHVLHGRTLTTPVELIKCLKSIKDHAFTASSYPVILTLEDHLTPHLQSKVAHMLTETFGDALFFPESETIKGFPSPEELKHKIVISTKPPKEYLVTESLDAKESNSKEEKGSPLTQDVPFAKAQSTKEYDEVAGITESEDNLIEEIDDNEKSSRESCQVPSKPPVYKRLIAMPTIPRHNLKEALKGDPDKATRLSLSEETLEKTKTLYAKDLVRFTQRNMLRIFPKQTRFNSSNYKPLHGWTHGAQMVAFNMQGHGKYLWWMQGMFRANGGCGYVKKPDFLLNSGPDDQIFDPKADMTVKTTLKVKVYMGSGWNLDFKQTHFDKYSPPDFYTKVGIAGVPADESTKKTNIKEDQWTPIWDEEFEFPLRAPELALLRIEVSEYDISEKDDFAGQTCLPVWELRPGIRAVPLYNSKGEQYKSVKLLVRFLFT